MSESEKNLDLQNKRDYLYALVLAVYRVTDKFPPEEHLRLKMREEAVNILSHVEHIYAGQSSDRYVKFVGSIQTLVHYCEIASEQKWLHETNFEVLKHELFKLRNSFEMPEEMEPIRQGMQEASYEVDLRGNKMSSAPSSDTGEGSLNPELAEGSLNPELAEGSDETRSAGGRATDLRTETASSRPAYGVRASTALYMGLDTTLDGGDISPVGGSASSPEAMLEEYGEYAGAPRKESIPPASGTHMSNQSNQFNKSHQSYKSNQSYSLNDRHEIILSHISETETMQVQDLSNLLPDVSPRTIRRDLDKLIKFGKITKHGKTNGAKYRLV